MFKLIFKSALASLLRRKLRTALVITMIAMSLWGLLLMQGIYDGMVQQMIGNAVRSDSSQLSIFAKGFRAQPDVKLQLQKQQEIKNFLAHHPNVKSHISRILSRGLIATARYNRNALIYGIDPGAEITHASLNRYVVEGAFDFGDKRRGALLGYKLAKKLKISPGDKVVLSAQSMDQQIASVALRVKGVLRTNNLSIDESGVFMHKQRAKAMLGLENAHQIAVMVHDYSRVATLQTQLRTKFPGVKSYTWEQLYPALQQSRELMELFNSISYAIVFCTAAIGIFGVVLVSVLERLREFGVLRAIGTRFGVIAAMIFAESFLIGVAGFAAGSLLGGATLEYFAAFGLDLRSFSDALGEFGIDAVTYAMIKPEYFTTSFVAVFAATFLSVLIPLRILRKSKPVEVINE